MQKKSTALAELPLLVSILIVAILAAVMVAPPKELPVKKIDPEIWNKLPC